MPNKILRVEGVSQRFDYRRARTIQDRFTRAKVEADSFWALEQVSFDLEAGKSLALLGANGSGKSTLLKVVGGIYRPTTGNVYRKGRLGALLELGAGFHPELTGRENIYLNGSILGLSKKSINTIFDDIVDFSGISQFIDSPVKTYSSGMYVRLGFAVAVHVDPDLLLVDEVLAVGDEAFQNQCLKKVRVLQSEGRSIVLVTHSMDNAIAFTQESVLLKHGQVVYAGPTEVAAGKYHQIVNESAITNSNTVSTITGKIVNSDSSNTLQHKVSADVNIDFAFNAIQESLELSLNVEIWTSDGYRIVNSVQKLLIHSIAQSHSGTITLRNLVLGEGEYRLALRLMNTSDDSLVAVNESVGFIAIPRSASNSGLIPVEVSIGNLEG